MRPYKTLKPILSLLLLLVCLAGNAQISNHFGIRPEKLPVINEVVRLMNASAYDSAEVLVISELLDQQNKLTPYEEYFLNSYEAEIMYYNALFDIGLASAEKCLAIGRKLDNDTLIGSAQNLLGLQLMHLEDYEKAASAFKEGIRLLPPKTDKNLYSQRYHALANLAEVYLYQKCADSTIYYSELAVIESSAQGIARGTAFSYWSWAEGQLLLNNIKEAKSLSLKGLGWLEKNDVSDANLFLSLTLMKIYFTEGNLDSLAFYQNKAEFYMNSEEVAASDFAKMAFLDFLVEFYTETKQMGLAVKSLNRARNLQSSVLQRQEKQRAQLLETFYSNREAYVMADLKAQSQARELKLKNVLNIILGTLVVLGTLLIFNSYRNIKHRQRINALNHLNQLQDEQQRLELESLKQKFEAVNTERNRIAADLHDEIGAALSSIQIFSNIAQKNNSQQKDNTELLAKINSVSSGLLDRISDIIWSISPEHQTLLDLKLRIKSFAADLLFPLGIEIIYDAHEEDDEIVLSALAKKNLYLCFKEMLNNIAKYSKASKVVLVITVVDQTLHCMVKDNGIGFDPVKKVKGNGLNNMKKRIDALGGEFTYASQQGEGVELVFRVPLTNISD
jgi:signal transduction histidine kinase